jgi:hypothetical protein
MRRTIVLVALLAVLCPCASSWAATVIISEFMANNTGPLSDEDGEDSDWIEIQNTSTNTVNLNGWYLTDKSGNLTKWRFPSTNIAPNSFMIVWASEKDRRTPGRPLHTNFKLDTGGEFLALVMPDGVTKATEFSPTFPVQVPLVSYGFPNVQSSVTLVATGAAARVYVPSNDVLGTTWIQPGFDDSGWLATTNGVGYERDSQAAFVAQAIADSVTEFSGKQGSNSWYYGYWNRGVDPNGVYSDFDMSFFPNADEPYGANNFWTGTNWTWFNGNPPFTQITTNGARGSSTNGGATPYDHAPIRRYVSEVSGQIKITGRVAHAGDWQYVTQTGVAANSVIYIYPPTAGDCYIDDVKVVEGSVPEVGGNLLPNGDFETALTGPWAVGTNLTASVIVTDVKHNGSSSLHVIANAGGTTQSSAVSQTISPALTNGSTYTVSYWYKPGTNNAQLVVRFSGNWINTTAVGCGDGVTGRIFVDGAQVYQQDVFNSGANYNLTVGVTAGSRVDFMLDSKTNDACDDTMFTAHIDTADPSILVADSVADWSFSGTQGEKNWFYGYYNRTADPGGIYSGTEFVAFPRSTSPFGAFNYWTGTIWDWPSGNPPWDEIGQTTWHPNGVNNSAEHWMIRRWVSEVSGRITVDWTLAKANLNGNGVTGHVFHNGVEKDVVTIAGNNGAGVSRSVVITNVQIGDFIDVALDPTGVGGATDDGSDGSTGTVVIRGVPTLTSFVAGNVESAMYNVNSTAYIRIPFNVTDPSVIQFLTLRMRYDDGFAAYLNGSLVASRNASLTPDPLTWNSTATANRSDGDVGTPDNIDISSFAGLLHVGTNELAIHGLNVSSGDSDFLMQAQLIATSVSFGSNAVYFAVPTPGAVNGTGTTNLGPIVANVQHTPNVPLDNEDLYVTAQIARTFNAISNVVMVYRIAYSNEVTVSMFDDGLHGDGAAGDEIYGAMIPASAAKPGQMIRYYISATDVRTNRTRLPSFLSATLSPEYFGTMVDLPQTNSLPILHWFIQNPTAANTDAGTRASFFYNGQFFDNIGVTLHGQSSAGFPKHSYNFNLNPGYKAEIRPDWPKMSDFAVISTWADRSHFRIPLNTEAYQNAGTPAHVTFPLRVHQNETFYMVANFSEQGNNEYLERIGYDDDGALYKMYNTFTGAAGNEKKTRKYEDTSDLQNFYNAIIPGGTAALNYIYDNVNLPSMVNFLAAKAITSDHDCCHKNYYFYRDSNNSGEWYGLPWDFDLSWGHVWISGPAYFSDTMNTNLGIGTGNNNTLFAIMWSDTTLRSMWVRRIRSLMDGMLQAPGTSTANDLFRSRIDSFASIVRADATLDKIKWGGATWTAPAYGPANPTTADATNNFEIELARLKDYYLPGRRTYLASVTPGTIPAALSTNVFVPISALEFNPASSNQAQEYIEFNNTNNAAVDISGWRITGGVDFTFAPGTVVPALTKIYVAPDVKAFRSRTTGPRGGQKLFVVGGYKGQLSARGETLTVVTAAGQTNSSLTYTGAPSLAQQYLRITELMYHPSAAAAGSGLTDEDYEYIELKNISTNTALNLVGIHFTNGVEFAFAASSPITNLAAGHSIVLVKNAAAFTQRYGNAATIAGAYIGSLDNSGERLGLVDAMNEEILDFSYNNSWYRITDGLGFSLVIVNENAEPDMWNSKTNWRASGRENGSPGGGPDPEPISSATVLVNEVLANTIPPLTDSIELWNPGTNEVNIGNWYLSDDYLTPKKYRIPAGTSIAAGGYIVFTEAQFNIGATKFAFSSAGDEAYVFAGDGTGSLLGFYDGFHFEESQENVSFGRYITSQTNEHIVPLATNTFPGANSQPRVGPVVISEIMYHPPDVNGADDQFGEFVELQNLSSNAVALYDTANPTNTWKLKDAVSFTFPTNLSIAPGSFLVVVSFNPQTNAAALASFRSRHGLDTNVPIVGPYSGKLDNSANNVELAAPQIPGTNGFAYYNVDKVDYRDDLPWPAVADGFGASLQRIVAGDYGNDPTNWSAALASPGAVSTGGVLPQITADLATNVYVIGGTSTNLTIGASGTDLHYQWQFKGTNIPNATNAALALSNVQSNQAGIYQVAVFNGAGAVLSAMANLFVLQPITFSQQPANISVSPGSNATLTVSTIGAPPVTYQWRLYGTNIPNATNASYVITNAELFQHAGVYNVLATDAISSGVSSNATVLVLVKPILTNLPPSLTVLQGGNARFELNVGPNHPTLPLTYRWIFVGGALGSATSVTERVLYIFNCQTNGSLRAQINNPAGQTNVTSGVTLTVLPDFDGDGMADAWEVKYNSQSSPFATNSASDALLDYDGDGAINRDEYVAGTVPTNSLSVLKLLGTNTAALRFVAESNISYTIQVRPNVNLPWQNWSNVNPQNTPRNIEFSEPRTNVQRYYRVLTPQAQP